MLLLTSNPLWKGDIQSPLVNRNNNNNNENVASAGNVVAYPSLFPPQPPPSPGFNNGNRYASNGAPTAGANNVSCCNHSSLYVTCPTNTVHSRYFSRCHPLSRSVDTPRRIHLLSRRLQPNLRRNLRRKRGLLHLSITTSFLRIRHLPSSTTTVQTMHR